MAEALELLLISAINNQIVRLIALCVFADTFFGCVRAIKHRSFNSSFGIDGAIRKVSMLASIAFLLVLDRIAHINAIGFLPEELRAYLPGSIGLAEFFGLLYAAYETVSILKNMTLCGLPVKRVWEAVAKFLGKYTDELPDND